MNRPASSTTTATLSLGVCVSDDHALELQAFAVACGVDEAFVGQLVEEGLVQPAIATPTWRFGGEELGRVRRICRLQRDFGANLHSVAVMLDLLDENDRLRVRLLRAGERLP
jgi:chaperone modulatory protein CbpM